MWNYGHSVFVAFVLKKYPPRCKLWTELNYSEIEPIRLSEEWLKRMGFILKENRGYFAIYGTVRFHGDYLELTVDSDGCWYYNFDSSNVSKIVYVHQLQNLFFALTGSELTINL